MAFLNLLIVEDESVVVSIPTQRLVFLVKHLIQCLQSEMESLGLKAEIVKTLTLVLPCLNEIYGSHWEESMDILSATWRETNAGDEALPVLLSSFKLFACLRKIVEDDESNDDVKDAWSERKATLFNDLTSTISKFGECHFVRREIDLSLTQQTPRLLSINREM